jgi:hypothetical protein
MLYTKFSLFEKASLNESFEDDDLTPGATADNVLDLDASTEPAPAAPAGNGGAIADDPKLDLTKVQGTLGQRVHQLMVDGKDMTGPQIAEKFNDILASMGPDNRTAKRWRENARKLANAPRDKWLFTLSNIYLAAAGMDVNGNGLLGGGRSRYDG